MNEYRLTWKILDDRNVHRLQMFPRPDSGEQQQLRRIYGTTGGDYLLCGAGNSKFAILKTRSLKLTSSNSLELDFAALLSAGQKAKFRDICC